MKPYRFLLASPFALPLAGCVTVEQAQKQCAAFGFNQGTVEFANCVQQQHQANQSNFQQRMLNASAIMNANNGTYGSSYTGGASGTAFLKSNYVSGMNRICVYNRMGSQFVMTISAGRMCPISVP